MIPLTENPANLEPGQIWLTKGGYVTIESPFPYSPSKKWDVVVVKGPYLRCHLTHGNAPTHSRQSDHIPKDWVFVPDSLPSNPTGNLKWML